MEKTVAQEIIEKLKEIDKKLLKNENLKHDEMATLLLASLMEEGS